LDTTIGDLSGITSCGASNVQPSSRGYIQVVRSASSGTGLNVLQKTTSKVGQLLVVALNELTLSSISDREHARSKYSRCGICCCDPLHVAIKERK
jgi:hypothetical protein